MVRRHFAHVLNILCLLVPVQAHAQGLVAAYSFNEGTGTTVTDLSGNGNNGTISGATWNAAGRYSGALSFDGVNDMVTIPDAASLDLTTGMTLEAWIRPTSNAGWRTVILKETTGELAYGLYSAGGVTRPSAWIRAGTVSYSANSNTQAATNTWTHVAATYDGAVLRIYTGGVLRTSRNVATSINVTPNPLRIGGNSVWSEWFSGLIDEVRVYNRALTAAQIQTDMNTPLAVDAAPPTGSITSPTGGTTVAGTVTVTAAASDDTGVAGVQFLLDGAALGAEDTTSPYSVTWNTASALNGAHTLSAVIRDTAGKTANAAGVPVTVFNPDMTPPAVSLTSPANGSTVSGTISLSANATDASGVAGVQFLVDNVPLGAEVTAPPYTVNWNAQASGNGPHTVAARARDAFNNQATASANVTVAGPDFSFTLLSPPRTVGPTGSTFFEMEVAYLNGFVTSSGIALSVSGLPSGATGQFLFNPMVHQGKTELLVSLNGTALGSYPFTLSASSEGITHTQQALLTVSASADFQLTASPSIQNVRGGDAVVFSVSLAETNDFVNPVTLSVQGLPAGVTASFNPPAPVPAGNSTLTLTAATSATPGSYNLSIRGVSGALTRTTPITLNISASQSLWSVRSMGTTGVPNNTVRVGALKNDGVERVYIGTIQTGRMLEYSWNGTGWAGPADVGGSPTGLEIHDVNIGPGRGDGKDRLYAASYDFRIYEIWNENGVWQQMALGTLDNLGMHAAVGDGRNDGTTRVYAISTQRLYEFTWNGTSWTQQLLGNVPGAHGIAVGKARADGKNYVYIASISNGTFEARFDNGVWTVANMGDSGDARGVELGVGRNDGVLRVYSALLDGRVREFTWNGTAWTMVHLPLVSGAQHIHAYIVPGRGDGVNRIYTSSGNGKAYEYSWNGTAWSVLDMGGGSDYMYGLHYGKPRGDGVIRFYGADRGAVNRVYEYTWTTPPAADTQPPTEPTTVSAIGGIGTVALSWTAATDNTAVVLYNVHRSTNSVFTPSVANRVGQPAGTSFNENGLTAGTYYYIVTAQDSAGNIGPASLIAPAFVSGDTVFPTVSLTAPANNAQVSNTITLTANASDNLGVAGVTFLVDGNPAGAEDTTAPYSLSWNSRSVPNGAHTIAARVRDTTGNLTTSSPVVNVTVSNSGSTGLVSALSFNEGSGTTVADSSGNGNNGTIAGATWSAGRFGSALSFNGASSMVTVPDSASLDLTNGMTLEAWVNPVAISSWRTVILKEIPGDLSYALYANGDNSRPGVWITIGGTTYDTRGTAQIPVNTWTHLAATYDGTTMRMYVNGTQVSSRNVSGSMSVSGNPLRIGGNTVWSEWFQGLIDEVRIYNRALSAAEIAADRDAPL